jgi:hypothetical protein
VLGDDAEFVRDVGGQQSLPLERRKRVFAILEVSAARRRSRFVLPRRTAR